MGTCQKGTIENWKSPWSPKLKKFERQIKMVFGLQHKLWYKNLYQYGLIQIGGKRQISQAEEFQINYVDTPLWRMASVMLHSLNMNCAKGHPTNEYRIERKDGYGRVTLQWRNLTTLPQAGDQGQYQCDKSLL